MSLSKVPQWLKTVLGGHLLTLIATLIFVFIGFGVGQIRELIKDVFALDGVIRWMTAILVIWGMVLIAYFLVKSPDETMADRLLGRLPSGLTSGLRLPFRVLVSMPTQFLYGIARLGRRFSGSFQAILVNLTMATIGVWVAMTCPLSPSWLSGIDWLWPLPGGFLRMIGMFAAVVALWLGIGAWVGPNRVLDGTEAEDSTTERRVRVWRRSGEVLSTFLLLAIVLETVWIAVEQFNSIDMSVYTVWAFLMMAFSGILMAAFIDFLYRNTHWPWRLMTGLSMVAIASLPSHVDLGPTDIPDVATGKPLGSQVADAWVEAALARLENEPEGPVVIVTASGGGSRAALVAALSLEIIEEEFRQEGQRPACVWMGSGVSGGGIALAAHYHPAPGQTLARDAVTRDYLGPIFRGFLVPFSNRGESLTAYWDRMFPWQSIDQTASDPNKPLLVFGVADIDTGRRVMVGFPRLPDVWYERWPIAPTRNGERFVLSDKDHEPYSLSVLQQNSVHPNVRLTRAVRMSSSFPFGFESTRIAVDVPEPHDGLDDRVHFLDGGMVDNTGVDSVLAILSKIDGSQTTEGQQLASELRRRGIFLIEIDAGAGSSEVAKSGPLSRVTQPFGGFNRGVFASAKRARDRNVDELKSRFSEDFTMEPIESYPESDEVTAVMTTLALPRYDIQRLVKSFEEPFRRKAIQDALRIRYAELLDRETAQGELDRSVKQEEAPAKP